MIGTDPDLLTSGWHKILQAFRCGRGDCVDGWNENTRCPIETPF